MTREEAIDLLVCGEWIYSLQVGNKEMQKLTEAISVIDTALTPPTQEQMERVFGAEWVVNGQCDHKPSRMRNPDKWVKFSCSKCGYSAGRKSNLKFCPSCGRAMTPAALEELRKRWEELNDAAD